MSPRRRKIKRVIRCARRRRGNTEADRKLLDALEEAALSSHETLRALSNFRERVSLLYMESHGRLFDFMLLWFVGGLALCDCAPADAFEGSETRKQLAALRSKSPKEQVDEVVKGSDLLAAAAKTLHSDYFINPQGELCTSEYKRVMDRNRQRLSERFPSILRELAVYETSKTFLPSSPLNFKKVKLADPEPADMVKVAEDLSRRVELRLLCTPKPTITHLENFQLALMHARLWLLRSRLPLCFGSSVTYEDARSGRSFEPMIYERAVERLPSNTETNLMLHTVLAHSELREGEEVYHMKHEDFLESSGWKTPGQPVSVIPGKKEKSMYFLALQEGMNEDEDISQTVRVYEDQEPERVLVQLQKFNPKSFARFGE